MGELVEQVRTNWQLVFVTAVLSVTGSLLYSQAVMGGNLVTRAEMSKGMEPIQELSKELGELRGDLGLDIRSIDRRLSRIEGQLTSAERAQRTRR